MYYGMNSENIHTLSWLCLCTFVKLFMSYLNFEAVTYTVENVRGGIGQDPATEVTHLGWVNQPPHFSSVNAGTEG